MREPGRRVAVTGIGVVCGAGVGWRPFWASAVDGRSCVSVMDAMKEVPLPGRVAGEVRGADLTEYFANKKLLRMVSRRTFMSVAAATLAIQDSGLGPEGVARERIGVYLGDYGTFEEDVKGLVTAIQRSSDEEGNVDLKRFGTAGIKALNPLMLLINIPNAPTSHISMQHDLRGPGNTFLTDFIASAQAIGEAAAAIRVGDADCMVAGGLGLVNPLSMLEFRTFGLIRGGWDDRPARAVRPFDETSGDFAPAEGAAFLLLEEHERAEARDARVYAELSAYASAYEPSPDDVVPDHEGRAISRALSTVLLEGDVDPAQLDCVVASGVGHRCFDLAEGRALRRICRDAPGARITALTPVAGHLQGAMGALQAAAACLILSARAIPPIANHLRPPAELAGLPFVAPEPRPDSVRAVAVSSVGMRGQAAGLLFRRAEAAS